MSPKPPAPLSLSGEPATITVLVLNFPYKTYQPGPAHVCPHSIRPVRRSTQYPTRFLLHFFSLALASLASASITILRSGPNFGVARGCPQRGFYKSVPQECPTKVSRRVVRLFSKSVPQECPGKPRASKPTASALKLQRSAVARCAPSSSPHLPVLAPPCSVHPCQDCANLCMPLAKELRCVNSGVCCWCLLSTSPTVHTTVSPHVLPVSFSCEDTAPAESDQQSTPNGQGTPDQILVAPPSVFGPAPGTPKS